MEKRIVIVLGGVLIALRMVRRSKGGARGWFGRLKGWQKVVGVVAILLAILIVLNPEFFVLGFLGDSAFFDVLVFGLSLQMMASVELVWRRVRNFVGKSLRWMGIPSSGLRYLMAISMAGLAGMISAAQKVVHRIGW